MEDYEEDQNGIEMINRGDEKTQTFMRDKSGIGGLNDDSEYGEEANIKRTPDLLVAGATAKQF